MERSYYDGKKKRNRLIKIEICSGTGGKKEMDIKK